MTLEESTTITFVTDETLPSKTLPSKVATEEVVARPVLGSGSLVVVQPPKLVRSKANPSVRVGRDLKPHSVRGDLSVLFSQRHLPASVRGGAAAHRIERKVVERKVVKIDRAVRVVGHQQEPVQAPEIEKSVEKKTEKKFEKKIDPVDVLLLTANESCRSAATVAEFGSVIDQCVEVLRLGTSEEKKQFAQQLVSWALNRRGQLYLDEQQQQLARADFHSALDYNSGNWRALHNRAVLFAQAGQFAEAFDDFNQVIELNPGYAKAYANRATLYVQANDLHSALDDYLAGIEIDDQLVTAYVGLARVHHMLGNLDESVGYFGKAAQLDPTNPQIICSRADLLADLGRYAEALADYARTIELDSEFGHAYRNGAWLLATCPDEEFRDPKNALLGARHALDIGYGERHVTLDTLAAALASAGEYNEAISTLQEAIDLAPEAAKVAYLFRLEQYQRSQSFQTPSADTVEPVFYEVTDQ